ncbi:hypothetical protein V8G54_014485, partial [Vigna mungo]
LYDQNIVPFHLMLHAPYSMPAIFNKTKAQFRYFNIKISPHLFNASIKTKLSPLTSSSHQYFHLQRLLSVTQKHGISSGVHRVGATQAASSSAIRIGPHQKTPHHPLVLHGLPRFLRTRHCVAREAAGIAVRVGRADPGNPAGGEVLGDGDGGGGGGGELRRVSVRVPGRG